MPANRVVETAYIGPFSGIDSVNAATLYKPGELGIRLSTSDEKQFQLVQLDTGALTSATNGQVAYWKDRTNYIVTNNNDFAEGGVTGARNTIAGVVTTTVTAGYFTYIQQQGYHSAVAADSGSPTGGAFVVGSTNAAKATSVAVATAPTVDVIGHVKTTQSSTTSWPVILSIPGIP